MHVIHWRCDPQTPRGPGLEIRPRPKRIITWAEGTRLVKLEQGVIDLPPWHYGCRFKRISST